MIKQQVFRRPKIMQGNNMALPAGPQGLPLLGNWGMLGEDTIGYQFKLYKQWGDLFTIHIGPKPLIMTRSPKYNRFILSENAENFLNGPALVMLEGPILVEGILAIDSEKHKQARRTMQPAFHKKRIESYQEAIVNLTEQTISNWSGEINLTTSLHHLTLTIVAKTLFDLDISDEADRISRAWNGLMYQSGHPVGALMSYIPFRLRRRARAELFTILMKLIA